MFNIKKLNTEAKKFEIVEKVATRIEGLERIATIRRETINAAGNTIGGPHYILTSNRNKIIA